MPLPLTVVGAGGGGAELAPGGTPLVAVGGLEAGKTRSVIFSLCLCSDLSEHAKQILR